MSDKVHRVTGHVKSQKMSLEQLEKLARFRAMAERQLVNLGAAIEAARKAKGLSRTKLARLIPVEPKTVERWEKGRTGGAMENLASIAKCLDTTTDALLADAAAQGQPENNGKDLMDALGTARAATGGQAEELTDTVLAQMNEGFDRLFREIGELRQLLESDARTRRGSRS